MANDNKNSRPRYSVSDAARAAKAVENSRRANLTWAERRKQMRSQTIGSDGWKRETHSMPRDEAREITRKFLKKYPKAVYWSEVESWRVLPGGDIEFTLRRLPSAD